jgi:hypothetical protein
METAARIGWLTRAVLYGLVAVLVARIPSTGGEESADKQGAFATLADSPLGGWLLGAVIVGMLGFAGLRAWTAIIGSDEKVGRRLGWTGSAIVYVALAVLAFGVLRSGDSDGNTEKALTVRILELPGGPVYVAVIALVVVIVGLNHLRKAVKKKFLHDVDEGAVPGGARSAVRAAGVFGLLGRSLVWVLVGWFLARAAVRHDPNEPIGLDESLRRLAGESWGPTVLWVVAIGLAAYGVFCLAVTAWPDPEPDG